MSSELIIRAIRDIEKGSLITENDLYFLGTDGEKKTSATKFYENNEMARINSVVLGREMRKTIEFSTVISPYSSAIGNYATENIVEHQPIIDTMLEDKVTKAKREVEEALQRNLDKKNGLNSITIIDANLKDKIVNNIWL